MLDGLVAVEVYREPVAEVGPGAILGERAGLEGHRRIATLRAVTRCVVAATAPTASSRDALLRIADTRRREANE
jgi:CRP-like cAMP-binding protein